MRHAKVHALAALLVGAIPGTVQGFIESATVRPREPYEGELATVKVSGAFPDTCWSLAGHEVRISGADILIEVQAVQGTGGCLDVLVPYEVEASLGRLDSGSWLLTVVDPQETKTFDLTVLPRLVPGDADGNGATDVADAVAILLWLFAGGPAPPCEAAANADAGGKVDVTDAIHILTYLFSAGSPPLAWVDCRAAEHCALHEWTIFCVGRWDCDCGECVAVCDGEGCGDGVCDVVRGETPTSCPGDCKEGKTCRPVCERLGTRSEGWYDSCTGERYLWANCAGSRAECLHCPSKSEGWYDSSTGELILWADCDCE